ALDSLRPDLAVMATSDPRGGIGWPGGLPGTTLLCRVASSMRTLVSVLLGFALLLGPRSGWGCELPATGQTTCWDSNGNVIPCAGTGQDGELRKGAPLAYVDHGNGTVTDLNTGLVWEIGRAAGREREENTAGTRRSASHR